MFRLVPDFICNLIVGDTFYFADEDFFETYHKKKAKYDGWKFYCVMLTSKPNYDMILTDIIGFAPDWEESGVWPEVWRGLMPREAHVVVEAGIDPQQKRHEWREFAESLRVLIQEAIDEGEHEEVIKTRGVQLVYMIDFLESQFSTKKKEDNDEDT